MYVPEDFFECCLYDIEQLLLDKGWNDYSYQRNTDGTIDLERAIEQIARIAADTASDSGYPMLATLRDLSAELKAYLSIFMPATQRNPRVRADLTGFNNSDKTHFVDVLEVLE